MVTRIYTPPVMSYYRAQQLQSQTQEELSSGQSAAEHTDRPQSTQQAQPSANAFAATPDNTQQPSSNKEQQQSRPLLANVREAQRIPMGSILQDFKSTLNALGVDETTQQEVNAYLGVAALQAQKDSPDVGFIRQSLKTAAGTLDQYISNALQQPSNVVRDWVDALLLQPIDFHLDADSSQQQAFLQTSAKVVDNASTVSNDTNSTPVATTRLTRTQAQSVKDALQQSKIAYQNGNNQTAREFLLNAKNQLPANSAPALNGRIALQLGKIAQDEHKYSEAKQYFQEAVESFEPLPNSSGRLAQSYLGLAESEETLGNWNSAQAHFKQAINSTKDTPGVGIQARNGLGAGLLKEGQPQQALSQFLDAYNLAQQNLSQQKELPDILSNMGRVYQEQQAFPKAEKAYRLALKYAKRDGNLDSYRATLGQLTNLYGQSQNEQRYQQVLSKLESLPV